MTCALPVRTYGAQAWSVTQAQKFELGVFAASYGAQHTSDDGGTTLTPF